MNEGKRIKVAVLPGDGIGIEVTEAAIPVFQALQLPIDLSFGDIGWHFWQTEGTPIPQRTWRLIEQADALLLGAITSKPEREARAELAPEFRQAALRYLSPLIQLRQGLELFANVRPCFSIKEGDKTFNFCVIRENTEGLYAGFDYYPLPEALKILLNEKPQWCDLSEDELSCSLRLQSRKGLKRLFEFAFQYALKEKLSRVSLADKPNVLRRSGAFARELFESIASQYPQIQADILNVDAVGFALVRSPEDFGVIVAENMFGDILSDVGAAVMGGLGLAPSANIGLTISYFEPVHGSAPHMPAKRANPSAMFLSIALLLNYLGFIEEAVSLKRAVLGVIREGRFLTYDLGGSCTTEEMAQAIIARCY